MDTKKDASQHCDDCKICSMVEHCDRAFMRTPANCEDYELAHVTETADASAEEAESKGTVDICDGNGNVLAHYDSVDDMTKATEAAYAQARTLADCLAAAKPKTVIISGKDVSPEEMAAFKFLNSATEPDSARAQAKLVGCVATPRGRVLVATGYGAQVHIVNAELFDFVDDVAYAVYKNKVGFAYVPCVDDDYSFAMVKACVEELDGDGVEMLFSAPKSIEDFIEWTYNAGKQGLPPFTFDGLKKLAVFKTAWRLRIPDARDLCVFKNGDCVAKLLPMRFFNAQKNGEEGEDVDEK